jgi:hypothetical protein
LDNVHIRYVKGVHGGLPNIPAVYSDAFRWLKGKDMELPDSPEGALSQHLAGTERSETPNLDGSAAASIFQDDPGFLDLGVPDPARIDAISALLDAEQLPAFTRVKLF